MEYLVENEAYRAQWRGVPINRDGKVRLRDGRTGEYFDGAVTILSLIHIFGKSGYQIVAVDKYSK